MRIFCKGFNLYNQLNAPNKCITDFECTYQDDNIDFFEMKHTFSIVLTSNNNVKVLCNFLEKNILNCTNLKGVKCIGVNDKFIIIADGSEQLYKFLITNPDYPIILPKFNDSSDSIKILNCGLKLNIAYTENGFLYSVPEKINFQNRNIIDIKTGREHCLLLDSSGNIYAFGRGSRGQLGLGQLDEECSPKLIEALAGIKIICIAAGGWHSAAVSIDGDLYMWGWNGNGQLGLSSQNAASVSVMATPQVVDIQNYSNKVLKVSCGNRHTITLLDNNHLCGSGWNKYKQLKNEDEENYYNFVFICDFSKECVDNIVCGPWSSAVICQ